MKTIQSRSDYIAFRLADKKSLGITKKGVVLLTNEIYTFEVKLRKLEYALNCSGNPIRIVYRRVLFRRISIRLGYSISPNTFGPGLSIAHRGTIVVNGGARIGANCRIHADVNIGTEAGKSDSAPTIGDNCYIGPGAKIFGPIEVGCGTVVGSNAVVNKSFPEGDQTLGGIPAKVISTKSSDGLLIKGYQL
ncbi:CysE Serine acetyltransferase [Candidatus Nanopelagicaceae bacterium]